MPNLCGTLPTRARQRAVLHDQARSKATEILNDIYERVERYDNALIPTQSYASLNIKCGTLLLGVDEKRSEDAKEICSSPFFEPRGASWVPDLNITDDDMRQIFQTFNDNWDTFLPSPLLRDLESQAMHLCSWLEHMFSYFTREGSQTNVTSLSKWSSISLPKGSTFPFSLSKVITTYIGYVSEKQLASTKETAPHTLINIAVGEEPSEDLFKAEVVIIAAAMISRLEGDECKVYSVIPIMLVTAMGGMRARVVQAHLSGRFLVLSKSKVFDFGTKQTLTANIDTLLGLMGSGQVGDPADINYILKSEVQQVVTTQGSVHKKFQSIRKFFGLASGSPTAPRESQKKAYKTE
ncbi:hypothetical protein N7535_002202 [Penicillium sp. DV-2018c]|nr:hypothetical protein N7535_002202 [Penicillium sp. DV-2018c]